MLLKAALAWKGALETGFVDWRSYLMVTSPRPSTESSTGTPVQPSHSLYNAAEFRRTARLAFWNDGCEMVSYFY